MRPLVTALLAAGLGLLLAPAFALAAPTSLHHQGRLLDAAGGPLNGPHDLGFALYAASSGGTPLWSVTRDDVPVQDGAYAVDLGAPSEAALAADALFLAITVDGVAVGPRLPVAAVPAAARAARADAADIAAALSGGPVAATALSASEPAALTGGATIGGTGGGRWLVLNDVPDARWALSTGSYALTLENDSDGTLNGSGGGQWTTRLRVDGTGRLGVGTTSLGPPVNLGAGGLDVTFNDSGWIGSDRVLFGVKEVNNGIEAQLYVLDDGQTTEAFAIYGQSCAGGSCADYTRASAQHRFDTLGNAWHRGTLVVAAGADLAERTPSADADVLERGDAVVIAADGGVVLSERPLDRGVYGVVSDLAQAPLVIGAEAPGGVPVALAGRVEAKVTDEGGPIAPGDLLVTSSTAGHLMRCAEPAACVGAVAAKALQPHAAGAGRILVLATLQ